MKVKGVNLGNWLVLEKWMNPALFEGMRCLQGDLPVTAVKRGGGTG